MSQSLRERDDTELYLAGGAQGDRLLGSFLAVIPIAVLIGLAYVSIPMALIGSVTSGAILSIAYFTVLRRLRDLRQGIAIVMTCYLVGVACVVALLDFVNHAPWARPAWLATVLLTGAILWSAFRRR